VSGPEGFATVPDQIRLAIKQEHGRVLDLFRSMDEDGSGTICRKEFVSELSGLGLADYPAELGLVFDAFDTDSSGQIDYQELSDIIRRSKPIKLRAKARDDGLEWWKRKVNIDDLLAPVVRVPGWRPYEAVQIDSPKWLSGSPLNAWMLTRETFPGTNRVSGKLAIVMHPATQHTALDNPTPSGMVRVWRRTCCGSIIAA